MIGFRPRLGLRRRYLEWSRTWADRLRGETTETFFDLHNPAELDPVLATNGFEPLRCDPTAVTDRAGAIRFVLGLLAADGRLRRQFRTALSDGPTGAFARWLARNGPSRYGLTAAQLDTVAAAFAAYPGEKGKRIIEVRRDLRMIFPFGLTPFGRGKFLGWMLFHGTRDLGLTAEEALWFLFETDETPDRGLVPTYLVRPDWQEQFPLALSTEWVPFKNYLRSEYHLRGRWFERAAPPRSILPAGPGVNVLAHFRYPSGLQEVAAGVVAALHRAGVATTRRDLPVLFPSDWTDRERYRGVESFDTTIVVTAANTFPDQFFPDSGLYRRPGVYRIAHWYWELEEIPPAWASKLRWADEIWAPTQFIAEAFQKVVSVPIVEMLPGVELPRYVPLPRSHFGMRDDRFTFLYTFDMHSTAARKNPLGVVEAFRRAFRPGEPVDLVIKVSRGTSVPSDLAALRAAVASVGGSVIDRVMPRAEVLGLLHAADCYVSLHRSEGLGLGLVESMLMGKPVVATAYSGNMSFMTPDVAYPVDYRLVPIDADHPAFPKGSLWADASVDHAAAHMRAVFDRPDDARRVGERAKRHVSELLSVDEAGRRMAARLAELRRVAR